MKKHDSLTIILNKRRMNNLIRKREKNNLLKFLFAIPLIFLLSTVLFSGKGFAAQNFKPGDILVTSKSETTYYTGHNAIVLENGRVLHSPAPNKTPSTLSASEWRKDYKTGVIIRPKSSSTGLKAAKEASAYYVSGKGKDLPYKIVNFDIAGSTFCTKLVADAYKRAGSPFMTTVNYAGGITATFEMTFAVPYDLKMISFLHVNKMENLGQY